MAKGVPRYFDGMVKECGNCFARKPLSEFSFTDKTMKDEPVKMSHHYRAFCKKCRVETMTLSQWKLAQRYDEGDTKIDECECGNYFTNQEWVGGIYNGRWETYDRCRECRKNSHDN